MYLARILYPIEVLGPGKRIGIWFCGCSHKCEGCSNPELWNFHMRYRVPSNTVVMLINKILENNEVDGFTITGGDPFEQPEELNNLTSLLSKISNDILVYSGYTLKELTDKKDSNVDSVLRRISVLIDGRYIEAKNNGTILRGSDNQVIHILNSEQQSKYEDYLSRAKNRIQNFSSGDGVISVGIHGPKFINDFQNIVLQRGLEEI